ncbi:DHA2 family efflux MFS transporter permease subunit [Streptomyces sp. NPDC048603]|uniref:DHA2 family efflux MFS transporter permease subunit n=1 Tax=Streptomyces sp. NPDC048603 TaxID=3365577 RepID=UPI00371F5363
MDRATVHRRRWRILAVLCLSLVLIGLDNLILNLALPHIQQSLGATGSEPQWIVDSYTLVFGGLLLLAGSLADRFGRKRLLLLGLALFLVCSFAAAFAGSSGELIAARAAMGAGAALLMPATLSIIKDIFPPEEQAKAVGIWAGAAALGVPLGPVVGGLLLEWFWWGSVFLVNVPVVLIAIVAGALLVPESRDEGHPGLDLLGALLSVAGLVLVVYALVEAPRNGWTDPQTLALLLAGAAVLAACMRWERRTAHPMLPPKLFGDARFGGTAAAITAIAFGMYGALYVLTQYLQFVLAYEPLQAGLRLLPVATMIPAAPLGSVLVRRCGLRAVVASGLALITAALVLMAGAGLESEGRAMLSLAVFGLGMGLAMPASADAMLAAVPPGRSGAGSAVTDTAMQIGGALGIAVVGSILTTSYREALPALGELPPAAAEAVHDSLGGASAAAAAAPGGGGQVLDAARLAFVSGLGDALVAGAAVTVAGTLAAVLVLPGRRGARRAVAPEGSPGGVSAADTDGSHPVNAGTGLRSGAGDDERRMR